MTSSYLLPQKQGMPPTQTGATGFDRLETCYAFEDGPETTLCFIRHAVAMFMSVNGMTMLAAEGESSCRNLPTNRSAA